MSELECTARGPRASAIHGQIVKGTSYQRYEASSESESTKGRNLLVDSVNIFSSRIENPNRDIVHCQFGNQSSESRDCHSVVRYLSAKLTDVPNVKASPVLAVRT